jgi:hypothetical protein
MVNVLSLNSVNTAPSSPSYDLVNVTLYYETLCPASRGFINGQLNKAFQSVGSIFSLTLVPYGNAWVRNFHYLCIAFLNDFIENFQFAMYN